MFKPLSTVLAAMLAGAVVAAVGFSAASAETAAGQTTAEQIAQIQGRLDTAAQNRDSAAVRAAADDLSPVLAAVHQDLDRGLAPRAAADPLAAAEKQTADLKSALGQRDGIFDSIKQMIQKLMDDLKQLVQQLLGGSSTSPTDPTKPTDPTSPPAPAPVPAPAPAPVPGSGPAA